MTTLPDEAVKAEVQLDPNAVIAAVRECARITAPEVTDAKFEALRADNDPLYANTTRDMERAIRAYLNALPFLPVQGAVNIDAIVQPLEDIHAPGGLCRWTDVATAIGEVRRALSALQPSPRDELMKQIREGTAYGFLNDGSQPEGNPDLDCPYCCGSGHKGDIQPSAARELALVDALEVAKMELQAWIKCADENGLCVTSTPEVIDHIDIALAALSSPDHTDAGKDEGDGWLPMTHPSLPKKGRFLAVATGEIERIAWNDPAAVVTVKAFDGPFVCYVHEDGAGFTDEFGEVYTADGVVIDAEDLTAADNVLRLTYWQPMPGLPSAPASEEAE